jgi:hypothetical protein
MIKARANRVKEGREARNAKLKAPKEKARDSPAPLQILQFSFLILHSLLHVLNFFVFIPGDDASDLRFKGTPGSRHSKPFQRFLKWA